MNFFNYCFDPTYAGTIWLYNFLFVLVTILAFASQKGYKANPVFNKKCYFLSFLVAWFFFVFNDTGTDLHVYIAQYERSSLTIEYLSTAGLEPGYRFIIAILHSVIKNPYVGIGLLKTIQLAIIYGFIYKLREKISVGYAIMAYMALYYFASFNVFRISLAGSLVFVSYVWLLERRWLKSIIIGAIACTIHNGAIFYALALILYFFYIRAKRIRALYKLFIILLIPVIAFGGRSVILVVLRSGRFMERYTDYATGSSTFGVMQIIFYLPLFYVLLTNSRNGKMESYEENFVFSVTGFAVALVGYSVGMLARVSILFSGPFMFFIPQYLKQKTAGNRFPRRIARISIIMVAYWVLRYILSIDGYFLTSGLYPYKFLF